MPIEKDSRGEKDMALRKVRKYKYEELASNGRGNAPSGGALLRIKPAPIGRLNILRARSKEVMRVDEGIRALLGDMVETMRREGGSGLAAVQIGLPRRVIVAEYGGTLLKLINPVIIDSRGENYGIEGCLSIPGVYGVVRRPEKVVIKALDERGSQIKVEATLGLARVLCHEIDHLDGVLFIDRALPGTIYKRA